MVDIILLAAGNSTRFNGNKLCSLIDGKQMFSYAVDVAVAQTEIDNIVIVTQYQTIIDYCKNIDVVINNNSDLGISTSIKLGLSKCNKENDVMFLVCDQPFLKKETVSDFLTQYKKSNKRLASISCNGIMGNPCVFGYEYKDELKSLIGDKGGKKIINSHLNDVFFYEINDPKELIDIDK